MKCIKCGGEAEYISSGNSYCYAHFKQIAEYIGQLVYGADFSTKETEIILAKGYDNGHPLSHVKETYTFVWGEEPRVIRR